MGRFDFLDKMDLQHRAVTVYLYLADGANKAGECWPAIPTIAKELKLSQSTVRRALQDLRKAELLETEQRYRIQGGIEKVQERVARPILVYDDVQAKRTVAITADGGTICVAAMSTAALGPTRLGGTNAPTGMMMTGLTVLGMATRVVAAPLIDRIGRKKRLAIGSGMKDGNTDRLAKAFAGGRAGIGVFSPGPGMR